jgi:hypothetical protein
VTGGGVHGGDHPVPRGLAGDPEHPVLALLHVLPGHQGQQIPGLSRRRRQHLPIHRAERGQGIVDQLIDQSFPGGRVVPVTRRLARAGVVIVAAQHRPDLGGQRAGGPVQSGQQLADCRPQLGHGVLGRDRVEHRRRVQHPGPVPHRPGGPRHDLGVLEQPPRPGRGPQLVPHSHQHRRMERPVPGIHPGRGLPAQVHLQPVTRLPVAQPLKGLQQQHRRDHPGRHRRPPRADSAYRSAKYSSGNMPCPWSASSRYSEPSRSRSPNSTRGSSNPC